MSVLSISKVKTLAKRSGSRLCQDSRGTAAIEFVLLVPLLMVFIMGTLEVSRAINVDKRVNSVTSMAGDLVSREEDMSTADLNGVMEVVSHVMHPYQPDELKMTVYPVAACSNDADVKYLYADAFKFQGGVGGGPSTALESANGLISAGSNVMSAGATIIVVRAEYSYSPLYEGFIDGFDFMATAATNDATWDDSGQTYTDQSIHSPRMGCVDFDNNNCVIASPPCS